jgi:uncharacterized membrane protein YphA (DoxX/SURF4 family)
MLNPFPIQFLSLIAYFILRFFLGILLAHFGTTHFRFRKEKRNSLSAHARGAITGVALLELFVGFGLMIGYYTQIATLLVCVLLLTYTYAVKRVPTFYVPHRAFAFSIFVIALSLFITGAGAFAFDLPI